MGKNTDKKADPAASKEGETVKKADKPKDSSKLLSPTNPIFVSSLFVISILATVAASYGVQHYRDVYVIPPQREKTFSFWKAPVPSLTLRNIPSEQKLLNLVGLDGKQRDNFAITLYDGETIIPIDKLDYYEYSIPRPEIGGKFHFKYENLVATISYIFPVSPHGLFVIFESSLRMDPANPKTYTAVITQGNEKDVAVTFVDSDKKYYEFPIDDESPLVNGKQIDELLKKVEIEWEQTYQKLYELDKQNMPKAYQTLGQSALSFLVNSLNQRKTINLLGTYDKNFTFAEKFHYLESRHQQIATLDEQVFPLITLSRFASDDVLLILNSWVNLINDLGNMGNRITVDGIHLEKTQAPLLFQLLKELLPNKMFDNAFATIQPAVETIAELTWKNSVGPWGLKDVKWLGHSRGIFRLEPATPKESSSFELLCLLEDMSVVMREISKRTENANEYKWESRIKLVETARSAYWNEESKMYGDLSNGKIITGRVSHTPLILSLLKEDSPQLKHLVENLEKDPLFSTTGLQLSEEYGAPVSTNFLLLQSLKRYSALSGPSQESVHRMYSQLKNSLIAAIARSNRLEKSFYGRFDGSMRPLGSKGSLDGTLVLPIMAELSDSYN